MKKRVFILFIILISVAGAYTQDKPVTDEENTIILPKKDYEIDIFLPVENKKIEPDDNKDTSSFFPETDFDSIILPSPDIKARSYSDGINTYINRYVQFILSSSDNIFNDKIYYTINGENPLQYKNPFTLEDEGTCKISYYGVDLLGNRETGGNELTVIVDNSPPKIVITSNLKVINNKYYLMKDTNFTASAHDAGSGLQKVEFSVNNSPFIKIINPFRSKLNTEGIENFNIRFRATDNVGNTAESFRLIIQDTSGKKQSLSGITSIPLLIDRTAPTVKITPENEFVYKEGTRITTPSNRYIITAADAGTGVKDIYFRVSDSEYYVKYTEPVVLSTGGSHKIEAFAEDLDGNKSELAEINFYIDIKPPYTEIKILAE